MEITFLGGKNTTMNYNADKGLYEARQYGKDWIDAETGDPLSFRNVMVLKAGQTKVNNYSSMYELIGHGDGFLAMGGKIVPIKWEREDLYGPFSYTFKDGTPVTFGTGKTYIAIEAISADVKYN